VQGVQGRLGARADAMQAASANLDAFSSSLTAFQSQLRDMDMEQAATEFSTRQTAYQAALLASSRLLSLDLSQYLK
jgi:flagellar hook-associated protein 3 FlgL